MTGPSFERVRQALDQTHRHYKPGPPDHIQAACPVRGHEHDDRKLSLSIDYKPAERKTDMWCFVCGPEGDMPAVREALGLTYRDLFDEPRGRSQPEPPPSQKTKPECGGTQHSFPPVGKPDKPAVGETWFPREWERSIPIAWKVRRTCKRCGDRTFTWRQPDGQGGIKIGKPNGVMPLGGLPDLLDAIDTGEPVHVYATEGDSDAEALRKEGVIAVTAGGTSDWKPEHVDQLDGVDRVTFCSDADGPGRGLAGRMRGWLGERGVTHRVVEPLEGYKDVRDHLEAGHTLKELVKIEPPSAAEPEPDNRRPRWVDLRPYLEGTRVRPEPIVGGERDDGIRLLYPKRWHTNIALTGAGKTVFALWHVKAILDAGRHVLYLHFEEPEPDGVIDRLTGLGVDHETIDERFHWADCSKTWAPGEMAYWLTQFKESPALAILDGINAACSLHGWVHGDPSAIGAYRAMFVTPLIKAEAAVLSLGHPPKARDRQNEIHGYGSTAWLDEVDGIGFRMVASKDHPMVIGGKGYSKLYVVKDRYSEVKRWGNLDTTKDQPWYYMGAFVVDDTADLTVVRLNVPPRAGSGPKTKEAILTDHIVEALRKRTGRFDSTNQLKGFLAADGYSYTASHVPVALEMLASQGRLIWPEVANSRSARPGWLASDSAEGDSE
jgi:hypothetical protein